MCIRDRGWRAATHVRYDISKVRYFDTSIFRCSTLVSQLSIRYSTLLLVTVVMWLVLMPYVRWRRPLVPDDTTVVMDGTIPMSCRTCTSYRIRVYMCTSILGVCSSMFLFSFPPFPSTLLAACCGCDYFFFFFCLMISCFFSLILVSCCVIPAATMRTTVCTVYRLRQDDNMIRLNTNRTLWD